MEVDILKVVGANSLASPRGFQCIVLAGRPADWPADLCRACLGSPLMFCTSPKQQQTMNEHRVLFTIINNQNSLYISCMVSSTQWLGFVIYILGTPYAPVSVDLRVSCISAIYLPCKR